MKTSVYIYVDTVKSASEDIAKRPIIIRIKNNKQKLKQQRNKPIDTDKYRAIVTAYYQRQQECVYTKTYTLI